MSPSAGCLSNGLHLVIEIQIIFKTSEATAIFSQSARLDTISGTLTLFLWVPSPGDAQSVPSYLRRDPHAGQGDIPPGGQRN